MRATTLTLGMLVALTGCSNDGSGGGYVDGGNGFSSCGYNASFGGIDVNGSFPDGSVPLCDNVPADAGVLRLRGRACVQYCQDEIQRNTPGAAPRFLECELGPICTSVGWPTPNRDLGCSWSCP